MLKNRFIIYALFFFIGCNQSSDLILEENRLSDHKRYYVEFVEDVEIEIGNEGFNIYDSKAIFDSDDGLIFVGYKRFAHVLDFFNIDKKTFIKSLILQRDGPNSFQTIYKIQVHNLDSIFIKEHLVIKIINENGEIKNSFPAIFEKNSLLPDGGFMAYNDACINFSKEKNEFIGFYFPNTNYEKRELEKDTPFICAMDVNSLAIRVLDIKYPSYIRNNYFKIPERMPNVQFLEDKIIYSFPFISNIYVYDFQSNKTNRYGGRSKNSNNLDLQDGSDDYDYRLTGSVFYNVEHIADKDIYLRGHWGSQERIQLNGEPSSGATKKGFLIFFDSQFNVINEIEINSDYWIEDYFVHDNHLYLYKKELYSQNENKLIFGKFEIQ